MVGNQSTTIMILMIGMEMVILRARNTSMVVMQTIHSLSLVLEILSKKVTLSGGE